MQLRAYQQKLLADINAADEKNILAVMPTGGGKTACMAELSRRMQAPGIAIAHRQELVSQISMAHARIGALHRIVAPDNVVAFIISQHIAKFGKSFVHPDATVLVAGVDTLAHRSIDFKRMRWWQIDEGHHVTPKNKWGNVVARLDHGRGIAWTATPTRLDRQALARANGGLFDKLIQGPSAQELQDMGFLVPIYLYGLPLAIARDILPISERTGDFAAAKLRSAVHSSPRIVGDMVEHYLRLAPGMLGVSFCVDVKHAEDQAAAYRQAGVPAAVLEAGINDASRQAIVEQHQRGEIKQICNVDIIGEGFDVPHLEVVSLGRATQSPGLCWQQIGRVMRPAPGKRFGLVLDHVGNLLVHGLPHSIEHWELDVNVSQRQTALGANGLPLRQCLNDGCWRLFESWSKQCPYCGWSAPETITARTPEHVEGDLTLFDPEFMEDLRKQASEAMRTMATRPSSPREYVIAKHMIERAAAQSDLREVMALWAGVVLDICGLSEPESYRRFFHDFGIDAATARTLGGPAARDLTEKIREGLNHEIHRYQRLGQWNIGRKLRAGG